jgi:hypothetical protein
METWGLKDKTMSQDAWAYVNITTILDGHKCLDSDCDAAVFFVASWTTKSELKIALLASMFLLENPKRQGLGITVRSWFE